MIFAALVAGCVLLYKGGDWLLDGVIDIGHKLKLSTAMIGLFLVSLGTSAPELFVSAGSALQGHGGMAAGNVVGSNIINISIVLGITVCVVALKVERMLRHQLLAVLALSSMAVWMMADGELSRMEGLCLIAAMTLSLVLAAARGGDVDLQSETGKNANTLSTGRSALLAASGVITLLIGAELLIWGGLSLAETFNLPQALVALTVTALGTSLPEIAASVVAVIRRETSMALGNVIGSNLLNIGLVLGLSAIITPLGNLNLGLPTLGVFIGLVMLVVALSIKPGYLPRWMGYLLVTSYCIYVTVLLNF